MKIDIMPGFLAATSSSRRGSVRLSVRPCVRNAFSNMLLQVKGQLGYVLMGQVGPVENSQEGLLCQLST